MKRIVFFIVVVLFLFLISTPILGQSDNYSVTPKAKVNVGDIITFGHYEQNNIEWQVLEVENGYALLISKYALDARPYNDKDSGVTWEKSTMRKWLNGEFYNTAFNASEKNRIIEVINSNEYQTIFGTQKDNSTKDRIFLLSQSEVEKYFSNDIARRCTYKGTNQSSWWRLRTPGLMGNIYTVYVDKYGNFDSLGVRTSCSYRPVLWLYL